MLPLIDNFALPLCERSGDIANRNIVVILSGSTYGYIRRYNVPAFSEAGIESIRSRSGISKKKFYKESLMNIYFEVIIWNMAGNPAENRIFRSAP